MTLTIYKPEANGLARVNRIQPSDYVSYSSPLDGGQWFVIVRAADGSNPRTFVLESAQLAELRRAA